MKRVSTAELKAHMGQYLEMVREGETVYVTSHRCPVARLSPAQVDESLTIQPPVIPMQVLEGLTGIRLSAGIDGVEDLLADRGRR